MVPVTVPPGEVVQNSVLSKINHNGSKLHFEIWGEGQKLNPEKWLSKQQ